MGGRTRALVVGVVGMVVALVPVAGIAAGGEGPIYAGVGEPAAEFDFGLSPKRLPSKETASATLKLKVEEVPPAGTRRGIASATIGLDRSIHLEPHGLPVCRWPALEGGIQIDAAGPDECDRAVVGRAEAKVQFAFPESRPITVPSEGNVYNAGTRNGAIDLLFELPFSQPLNGSLRLLVPVRSVRRGRIGSEMTIKVPTITSGYGMLFELQFELGRTFVRHRERAAYVEAKCRGGKLAASMRAVLRDGTAGQEEFVRACTPKRG